MSNFKKTLRFLSSVLFYSIMLILVVILFMFCIYFIDKKIGQKDGKTRSPLFGAYVIISPSMVPAINVYDAVVTVRVKQDKIKKYDIITFLSKDIETKGTPITHRVIGFVSDPNDSSKILGYRTKGDNNSTEDFAIISYDEVIGKVYLRIPLIGYVQTFLTKPIGWFVMIMVPCLLIIGSDILKLIKTISEPSTEKKKIQENIVADNKEEKEEK